MFFRKKESLDKTVFFFLIFAGILFVTFMVVKPVLSVMVLALLLSTLFHPVYVKLYNWFGERKAPAVASTLLIILLSVIIPIVIVAMISINQFGILIRDVANFAGNEDEISEILDGDEDFESADLSGFEDSVKEILADINERLNDLPFIDNPEIIELEDIRNTLGDVARDVASWIGDTALSIAQNTPRFAINLVVFLMLLTMFIPSQHKLKERILKLSPLDNEIDDVYIKKVAAMATSMVKGTFVIALVQGIISGILLWLAGVPYVFFWIMLCVFANIIPNGGAVVNWPITIAVLLSGNIVGAVILILGNIFVVASVDSILRPYLVSKEAQLHPGLTLVGVAGGVQVFGILGIIYGPVIMILLATTIDIYINHYKTS